MRFFMSFWLLTLVACAVEVKKPNIVFIMVDDLGYGDLSSYGAKDIKTPAIDNLMKDGMRFTEFTANSCVCSPTRAAFLTGRYQDLVGVPGVIRTGEKSNFGHFDPQAITLADVLKKQGYRTSLIGKWHLGLETPNLPNERGFEVFHGFRADMMENYWTYKRNGENYMYNNETQLDVKGTHATELFTDWAIADIKAAKIDGRPFFQFLAYNAPHDPIQPPKEALAKFKLANPQASAQRAGLGALIEDLDFHIGRVLKVIEEQGLKNDTIIIFTSDNGGLLKLAASNGALRGGKTQMYEGGLKVCTSVTWQGKIKAGSETQCNAMTMDFFPTLLEMIGVPLEHEIDGKSFAKLLLGDATFTFGERAQIYSWLQGYKKSAIRKGPWKLVNDIENDGFQLFNLQKDPVESTDVAKENPEKYQELLQLLQTHLTKAEKINWRRPNGN